MEQVEIVKEKNWTNYTIKSLAFWVIISIVAGIAFGMYDPKLAVQAKPGIDWFIQGLKWLVGPIIFLTIITGIVGLKSLKEVGSIGFKAFIYFEIVSTFALAIGVIFGNWFAPGTGMNLSVESLDAKSVEKFTTANQDVGSVWAILKGAIPSHDSARDYFLNTQLWCAAEEIPCFYFSSFDESWKVGAEGIVGAYWGIWDKNEKLKY